ncbi:MAG TPA: CARDB domain-containing protein, partial [Pirellulales bacterium]|nr:CARDB domain-containing protein [Pirellulales bacterium]
NYQNQLAAGASYVVTQTVAAPNVSPGARQLVFVTDTGDEQAETQKSNNLIALPITFTQADVDLTVTAATAPATATAGASIPVGWTARNQGGETAAGGWTDVVYLSDVPTLDSNAVFIDSLAGPASLAAGGTYSPSQTITLPGSASGNKYLLFVTNRYQTQGETNYANDVYAVPISLSTPDLQATALSGPSAAILGQKVQVSWSVTNQGSIAAPGGWSDTIYLSDTPGGNPFGLGDTYVGSLTHHASLAAGASYTEQQTFTLPASRLGARYLVVVANANGVVGDADPTNNRFAIPITLSAPDLAVTTAAAPASAVVNDPIQVSWTVKNQGSVAAPATWSDGIYLSSSPFYDGSAVYVGSFDESAHSGLAAGASYTETQSLTLPAFAAGQQYLLFVTNQYNGQPESDTPQGGYYGVHGANNVFAAPITLSAPDLAVTAASAPAAAVVGNGDSISLSYTVTNQGIVPADGSWSDYLYVSDRPTYDDSATYLASLQYHSGPLLPGASYSSTTNVTLPNTASGARYLLVVANLYRSQGESDLAGGLGANNVYALPITLTAPGVDLTVTGATAPASVIARDSQPGSFTVENQGSDAAGANWTDQVYFSTSPTLDSSAINLGGFSPAQSPLAAGGSYVQSQNVTLSGAPVGAGYLLFVANGSNDQSETDASNNVFAVPIVVSAPDLAVTAASAPTSSTVGNNQQLAVSYTVQNVGAVPAHGNWYDALYVSDLPTLDGSATFVTRLEQSPPALAAGASYSDNFNVALPPTSTGLRYLLFVTNAGLTAYSGQPESDGSNAPGADNVFAVPITLTAPDVDLAVSNVSAPASIVAGDSISVSFDVTNQGSDAAATNWTDGVYFSTAPTFDENQATLLGSFSAGQSPLAGGASYSVNRNVSIPSLPLGAGYLFFATNVNGNQSETDDGADNVIVLPVTIGAPDLAVTTVSAPAAANTGDSINVSWTVANQGASPAPASWTDAIYLSTKPTYDYTARYLGSFNESAQAGLAAGGDYNDSRTVSLPSYAPTGSLYLLVVTNAYGDQPESDAGSYGALGANNVYALPITIGAPDLAVTTASAPASAVVGNNESISVSYTVKNIGAVDSNGSWSDSLYLSDKPTYDSSATYVDSLHYNYSSLAAGSSYTQNVNVTLPVEATGNLYLLFVANLGGISESDSSSGGVGANNVYAVPISLSLPDVDLVASNPSAPATASLGQSIAVSFDVTNAGGESAALGWYDAVYYSSSPVLDSSAVYLDNFYPSQVPLGAGAGYSDSGNVTLPASLPLGAGYLLFVTNNYGGQGESDATNNVVSLPISLSAADLAATDVTAPASATFDSPISVSWTVANQGLVSAGATWYDAVYISTQPDWRSGTQIATFSETSHAGLAAGADYTDTRNVTIPSYLRAGDVYLIVVADVYKSQGDVNRLNNSFVTPIHLSPSEADLTIASATAPATGVLGSSIAVSWTVTNQGTKDASSSWYDSVYLSTKPTFDNTAVNLHTFNAPPAGSSPLTAGASYTLNANVALTGTATGAMYLLFVTNSNHNQSESDTTNDVYALPITLDSPDLTVTSASAPAAAALGQTISVSWTATNQGGVAAPAAWYDAVYVSSKNTFDNTATLLNSFYEGSHVPLAAAGSYTDTRNVTLPATGLGQRYLLFVADAYNNQPETSESNNVYAVPITLAAPDLTIAGVSAPAAAELGAPLAVSWTVQNASSVAAPAAWHDAVYVSSIPTLDGTATLVAQFDESAQAGLAGGSSYTESRSITLPSTAIGQRYLLFVTDSDHGQPQTSTANDVYAVPITLSGADLAVTSVAAPSIAALGSTVELSWTVTNQGNAAAQANWSDSIYLSDTNVLDGSATFVGSFAAGASPLAAGASYAQSQSVLIPNAALGSRYLLFVADASQQQAESNKANNVRVVPIQLAQVDLSAGSASAPTSANFGDAIDVSWTATNAGSTEINQPWSDRIYLSTSSTLDVNAARLLATVDASAWAPLAPGASYSQTARVPLPLDATTTAGSYYLFVVVDGLNQAAETDETNNATSQPISLGLPPLPDLAPTNIVVPASGLTGQGFNVSWTDQNNGTATAEGPWKDYVWISTS